MKVYKIRQKETGLWSTGGCYPSFTKTGKVWRNKQALGGHLSFYHDWRDGGYQPALKKLEIVEFEIKEEEASVIDAWEYCQNRKAK